MTETDDFCEWQMNNNTDLMQEFVDNHAEEFAEFCRKVYLEQEDRT